MSSFCCINLKNTNICANFSKYNELAIKLIKYAIENDIAVFFNSFDYGTEIIKSANMQNFIVISDSFIFKNCELLDNTQFIKFIENDNISNYKIEFCKKYKFLEDIINIILCYEVFTIELFITEDGAVDNVADFLEIKSSKRTLLNDLFECVINSTYEYGNEFPNLKLTINKI